MRPAPSDKGAWARPPRVARAAENLVYPGGAQRLHLSVNALPAYQRLGYRLVILPSA